MKPVNVWIVGSNSIKEMKYLILNFFRSGLKAKCIVEFHQSPHLQNLVESGKCKCLNLNE